MKIGPVSFIARARNSERERERRYSVRVFDSNSIYVLLVSGRPA
jgi:hypothetical protein